MQLTRDQLTEAKGAMVVDSLNKGEYLYEESDDLYAVNADVVVGYGGDGTPVNLEDEDCAYHVCSIHTCPKYDFEEVIIQ